MNELQGARFVKPRPEDAPVRAAKIKRSFESELARVGADPQGFIEDSVLGSLAEWWEMWMGMLARHDLDAPARPAWCAPDPSGPASRVLGPDLPDEDDPVETQPSQRSHTTPSARTKGKGSLGIPAEATPDEREALEWLLHLTVVTHPFLGSVQEQAERTRRLSSKQVAAVLKFKANADRAAKPQSAPRAELEAGIYTPDEGKTVFKVQKAVHGSGFFYAKRLIVPEGGGKARFEFEKGAISKLTPDMKMNLEQAKQFGAIYGVCCNCGATLTDENSIEAGIGPVCAGKFD